MTEKFSTTFLNSLREILSNGVLLNYDYDKDEVFQYYDIETTLAVLINFLKNNYEKI